MLFYHIQSDSASEKTYIVSPGALNSTRSPIQSAAGFDKMSVYLVLENKPLICRPISYKLKTFKCSLKKAFFPIKLGDETLLLNSTTIEFYEKRYKLHPTSKHY